jgi:hypothetical protein
MKYIFVVSHPAHVHFFKKTILHLKSCNHQVMVVAVDKEIAITLLEENNIDYFRISGHGKNLSSKLKILILQEKLFFNTVTNFNPDLIIARTQSFAFHCAKILGIPSVAFADTEHSMINYYVSYPFADKIVTPSCFHGDFGQRHERFEGYFELSYLHPNVFQPNPSILDLLGVEKDEKYIILRFVSWNAVHDIGHSGLSLQIKRKLVNELLKYTKVFITSEQPLPDDLEPYRIRIPFERIHDALYYSFLHIGEGATMVSECAMLGTPAIYINPLSAGTLEEQELKYGLITHCKDSSKILDTVLDLLKNPNLKREYREKQQKMLAEKIDVTEFIVDFIGNYPESI